jgi:hypothetical protein
MQSHSPTYVTCSLSTLTHLNCGGEEWIMMVSEGKEMVKFALEQTLKSQMGNRGIALLFNVGAAWCWVANATPWPLCLQEWPGTRCTEVWVSPRVGLDRCGKSTPIGIRSPDPPARSESLYRLSYPGTRFRKGVWKLRGWVVKSRGESVYYSGVRRMPLTYF